MQKNYKIQNSFDNDELDRQELYLPGNLNYLTVDTPNFISNDTVLYLTEDKIMFGFKVKELWGIE